MIAKVNDICHEGIAQHIKSLLESKQLYLCPDLSIADIALEMKVNPETVSLAFERFIARDFHLHINELRITHAAILFMGKNSLFYSIKEIGKQCGFNNYTCFSLTCIQLTGMTPESVREFVRSRKSLKGLFLQSPGYLGLHQRKGP